MQAPEIRAARTAIFATLRDARERQGLSQSGLAVRLQTTQPVLANLEGGRRSVTLDTLIRWTAALGLRVVLERCETE